MSWDGGGTFTRVHNFSADASAGIQAQAARFDAEFDEVKAGLENTVTLTGETTPTANQPMGGYRHTGVAAAVSADNYLRADQNAKQVAIYVRDTNAAATGVISASAAIFPGAWTDGQRISVLVSASGSAASTRVIKVNGLSANIFDASASAIPGANMQKGGVYDLVYDSSASGFKVVGNDAELRTRIAATSASVAKIQIKGKSAISSASTTTLADDPDMSGFTYTSGGVYALSAFIVYAQTSSGFKMGWDFSDAPATDEDWYKWEAEDRTAGTSSDFNLMTTNSTMALTDGDEVGLKITGGFRADGDGTLDFQWAKNISSTNNISMYAGSWMRLEKIN